MVYLMQKNTLKDAINMIDRQTFKKVWSMEYTSLWQKIKWLKFYSSKKYKKFEENLNQRIELNKKIEKEKELIEKEQQEQCMRIKNLKDLINKPELTLTIEQVQSKLKTKKTRFTPKYLYWLEKKEEENTKIRKCYCSVCGKRTKEYIDLTWYGYYYDDYYEFECICKKCWLKGE